MRDGRKIRAVALALALAASAAACGGGNERAAGKPSTMTAAAAPAAGSCAATTAASSATASADAVMASPAAPAPQPILSVLTVEHEVDVLTERDGVVLNLAADEGSRVRQGQVLAQLDDRTQRAQLAHDQDDLTVANDNVKYNEAELRAKQANLKRYEELRKLGLSSDADLEKARFEAEGAQYDLDSWHAVVKRTQAQIHMAELELAKMQVRAPFEGVVARRYVREGQALVKGDRCFRVTQLRPLRVRFPVPEASRYAPRVGERLRVSLASDPGRSFPARIVRVGPVVDPASGSWDVLAELEGETPADVRPGMAVEVYWPPSRR